MVNYVFSDEVFREVYGKPKGKGAWKFGSRDGFFCFTVGSESEPMPYKKAEKIANKILNEKHYPMYKTIYLLP